MRANRNFIYVTIFIVCTASLVVLLAHYMANTEEAEFWCNVGLALWGSGVLSLISAIGGYLEDRRRVLNAFSVRTRQILHEIRKYELKWSRERKIDFFMDYREKDFTEWKSILNEIAFLKDRGGKEFRYIYDNIYEPIQRLNFAVEEHWYHFRWHKDGSGKSDVEMDIFINELEDIFLENKITELELDEEKIQYHTIRNCLVDDVFAELNGHYLDIMYGATIGGKAAEGRKNNDK